MTFRSVFALRLSGAAASVLLSLLSSSSSSSSSHAAAAAAAASSSTGELLDGRYSFSLTTFDPEGRLGQVDRAMEAAALGATPLIAVVVAQNDDCILLAAPQYLPSPFMEDDGTARFVSVTSELAMTHTGLSADGRILIAAAKRLAIQHEYTFDEEIPVDLFLEELSMVCQEYTMKPGVRPFGVTLLVAYVPSLEREQNQEQFTPVVPKPQLFRVDPSGVVSGLGRFGIVNGHVDSPTLRQSLLEIADDEVDDTVAASSSFQHRKIASVLRAALRDPIQRRRGTDRGSPRPETILTAVLSRTQGFSRDRHCATYSAS